MGSDVFAQSRGARALGLDERLLEVHILRVFADENGAHGNELGVVFDAADLSAQQGTRLTAQLGFSETVFVDDREAAAIRIFNPAHEMKLAGHPTVGTAWLLGEVTGTLPRVLRPRLAGEVATWRQDGLTWIRGDAGDVPAWGFVHLDSPEAVDALPVPPGAEYGHHSFWAWIDEPAGVIRTRFFAPEVGVAEDEATGSAAMIQAQRQGRPLTIRQGRGSVIAARPAEQPGWSEIGGRVVSDGVRQVRL